MSSVVSEFGTSLHTIFIISDHVLSTNEIIDHINSVGNVNIVFYVAYSTPETLMPVVLKFNATVFLSCTPAISNWVRYPIQPPNIKYFWAEVHRKIVKRFKIIYCIKFISLYIRRIRRGTCQDI